MDTATHSGHHGPAYLVSAARTPIGKFGGALADVPAVELGAVAIRAAMERSGLPADVAGLTCRQLTSSQAFFRVSCRPSTNSWSP